MPFLHVLKTHPLLGRLSREELTTLSDVCQEAVFERNHFLQRQGEVAPGVFLVIFGLIKVTKTVAVGQETLMSVVGPDEVFGLCCHLAANGNAECSAQACLKTKTVFLPAKEWRVLLRHQPGVTEVLLEAMSRQQRECMAHVAELALPRVGTRLARLLYKLAGRQPAVRADGMIEVSGILTQDEMAAAIGAVRQMVTRRVADLVKAGILSRQGRKIFVRDLAALRLRAGL